eukprot:COSAG01_NODE_2212_length_8157_cov_20.177960_2_plen_72_part_00
MPSQRRVTVWIGNAKPLGIYTFTEYEDYLAIILIYYITLSGGAPAAPLTPLQLPAAPLTPLQPPVAPLTPP